MEMIDSGGQRYYERLFDDFLSSRRGSTHTMPARWHRAARLRGLCAPRRDKTHTYASEHEASPLGPSRKRMLEKAAILYVKQG